MLSPIRGLDRGGHDLMTEPGETDHTTAVDHVLAIPRHAPGISIHTVPAQTRSPIPEPVSLATLSGQSRYLWTPNSFSALGTSPLSATFLDGPEGSP